MAARVLLVARRTLEAGDLRALLRRAGYQVDSATSARTALAQARSHPPDLVIAFPDPAGAPLELLFTAVRARDEGHPTGLLAVTPGPDGEAVLRALAAGADWYLQYPAPPDYVLSVVDAVAAADNGERTRLSGDRRQLMDLLLATAGALTEN